MQKKLIALAVAGLVSVPAFAQSSVTLYGIADMGFVRDGGALSGGAKKTRTGIDSGVQSGSRIGFKGTEDLGNGLKANFVFETGLTVDRGGLSNNNTEAGFGRAVAGQGFGRQTYVGLSGGFGSVTAGRQYTPQFVIASTVDPFGFGLAGQINNLAQVDARLDNLVAYATPSFGGFTGIVGYTPNGIANEAVGGKGANVPVTALAGIYANGPLLVAGNYHKVDAPGTSNDLKRATLGLTYDLSVVKLHGYYNRSKNEGFVGGNKSNDWMLGLSAPIGKGTILASYVRRDENNADGVENDANQWALGYTYALSKRTNIYTAYAKIGYKKDAKTAYDNGVSAAYTVGNASAAGVGNSGFNLGVRHTF